MTAERFSLANRRHLGMFVSLLHASGALCPECGHATRKTSKNWARCKKCNARVRRYELDEISIVPLTEGGD